MKTTIENGTGGSKGGSIVKGLSNFSAESLHGVASKDNSSQTMLNKDLSEITITGKIHPFKEIKSG
jgi:hypothetical protein